MAPARITRVLHSYGSPHRMWFHKGIAAAVIVVGARVLLPWPLRELTNFWTEQVYNPNLANAANFDLSIVWFMGLGFLLLLLLHGWADHLERLYFARYAIATIRDIRREVFQAVLKRNREAVPVKKGEIITRLIADTEHMKRSLKSLLVHGITNGMVFAGVATILLVTNTWLGLFVAIMGIGVFLIAWWGSRQNRHNALNHRTKEGILANRILRALRDQPQPARFGKVSKASARSEASITFTQGLTAWGAHAIFGSLVLGALLVGTLQIQSGAIVPGDMVLFILYVLLLRAPIVRLARQGAQTGTILGTSSRLLHLLDNSHEPAPDQQTYGTIGNHHTTTSSTAEVG